MIVIFLLLLLGVIGFIFYRYINMSDEISQNRIDVESGNNMGSNYSDATIYIEAETGELDNAREYTHIGESSRGSEVYLGDGNAAVQYSFYINEGKKGNYCLYIRVFDDGKHPDGARNVSILFNDTNKLHYDHKSEAYNTWTWLKVGQIELSNGDNNVKFIKDQTTSAAFVMDAFRLELCEN